jgi:hypothetical protein
MLRDVIAPALRSRGLRGSGSRYTIPSDTHWALLGFQSSSYNTGDRVKFTVNCMVVRRDLWAAAVTEKPWIGEKPKANVGAGIGEWWERLGRLMPAHEDVWWFIQNGVRPDEVAAAVLGAIDDYALQAMRHQLAI